MNQLMTAQARDVLLSAAWVVNIVAAEWIIRRRRGYERAPARTTELAAATKGS
jgi:hypothetical protein